MSITQLKANKLRRQFSSKTFSFKTTDDLSPLGTIIGQDRALQALELGLEMRASGYNIFVTGQPETGKTTIIEKFLRDYASKQPTPDDWCYVYNFSEPDSPTALSLPAGEGKKFMQAISELIATLQLEIKRAFTSKHYENQRTALTGEISKQKRDLLQEMEKKALARSLQIKPTSMGFQTIPIHNNEPLSQEVFHSLSEAEQKKISENVQSMEAEISNTLRELAKLDIQAQKALMQLDKDVASFVVEQYVNEIKQEYRKFPQVLSYLEDLCKDIVSKSNHFSGESSEQEGGENPAAKEAFLKRYRVNVVVDNSNMKGAPVIFETNPTYTNLIGRIEKYPVSGTYITDFTMVKSGSLLKANGGYLMIEAGDMLQNPYVYSALKRSLKNKELRIEEIAEAFGNISIASLKPQAIPLNLKVIVIGRSHLYHYISRHDEVFQKIFKVRADFDYEADSNNRTAKQYAQFVKRVIDQESLKPFDAGAVEAIVQYGHRLSGSQTKISLRFGQIVKITQQSAYWARKANARKVKAEHVKKAIDEYDNRHSMMREKYQQRIIDGKRKIIVSGERVGEINALSVLSWGDLSFGMPNRITVKTYIGSGSFVSLDKKAGLTGRIHDKGSYTINGFFKSKFGEYAPLSFAASMSFEQNYGRIDGDSASSTELYVLLSSLSDVPINQGIAVTGSVNQNGEIQPIGGVNDKIEGFFDICEHYGLDGTQGVMIPRTNVKNLILKSEVIDAVAAGKFNIWAIDTIEDGLQLLTGVKAGRRGKNGKYSRNSIYLKAEEKMREFAKRSEAYRKSLNSNNKNNEKNGKPGSTAKSQAKKK